MRREKKKLQGQKSGEDDDKGRRKLNPTLLRENAFFFFLSFPLFSLFPFSFSFTPGQ